MSVVAATTSPSSRTGCRDISPRLAASAGRSKGRSTVAGRRWRSTATVSLPPQAIRDERMPEKTTLFRVGTPDLYRPDDEAQRRLLHMMRTRQEEMVVAELVAAVIWERQNEPWEFTLDLARHEWDEMRHALFGQAALEAEGVDWMAYPQFTGDYDINATNLPSARYAWLLGIEQNAMRRTGKRAEYEFCRDEAQHPLMTQFQDFDWADEVKHVHIGREWTTHLYDGDPPRPKPRQSRPCRVLARRRPGSHRDHRRTALVPQANQRDRRLESHDALLLAGPLPFLPAGTTHQLLRRIEASAAGNGFDTGVDNNAALGPTPALRAVPKRTSRAQIPASVSLGCASNASCPVRSNDRSHLVANRVLGRSCGGDLNNGHEQGNRLIHPRSARSIAVCAPAPCSVSTASTARTSSSLLFVTTPST